MASEEENIAELTANLSEKFPDRDFSAGSANYALVVQPYAANLTFRDEDVDDVINNMSIVQVLNNPDASDEAVDNILSNYQVTREEGNNSSGFINIYFAGTTAMSIPATATFTCSGLDFRPVKSFVGIVGEVVERDTSEVTYTQATAIGEGAYVFAIQVESVTVSDIVIGPNTECTFDLSSPYIQRAETASTFSGGTLPETTSELLERAALGITAKAASGTEHIRALLEDSEYNVLDSAVFGYGDNIQIRDTDPISGISSGGHADAYVITDSVIQTANITLTATRADDSSPWTVRIPEDVYPGAYGVYAISREGSLINGEINHILGYIPSGNRPLIRSAEEARFSAYQTLDLEFYDSAAASGETSLNYVFTVSYMPNIGLLQEYVENEENRASSFDIVVKAMIPIQVGGELTVSYPSGVVPPATEDIETAITQSINSTRSGASQLHTSILVQACNSVFPEGTVLMPVRLSGTIILPNGNLGFGASTNYLEVPTNITGVDPNNSKFFAASGDFAISLIENSACK